LPSATLADSATFRARALLLEGLLGRARNFPNLFGLVGTGAALGELIVHHAGQNIPADLNPEHLIGQLDRADVLGFEINDVDLHRH